jgi:hypothetical protein
MVKDGYIVLDDYNSKYCKGVKKAIDEFASKHNLKIIHTIECQVVIRI